jgi:MoxR-like ATPase
MPEYEVPFELITELPRELGAHRAEDKQQLLARRALPPFLSDHRDAARYYQPSKPLLLAINMALHTGSPLLLTGEPGTGKTQAADFVGFYFDIPVCKFLVKSTSIAQDLMYEFDAVGYLHWAQTAGRSEAGDPDSMVRETQAMRHGFLHKRALWQAYDEPGDAVVLIDEIDKAPRDFPNDLLHELDQHRFPHPFDEHRMISPKSKRPPIVIITSNEERRLPDAFLRSCIFHCIELDEDLIEKAVESMARSAGGAGGFPHLDAATRNVARKRFWDIRNLAEIEKKPATAELLTWLCILSAQRVDAATLENNALRSLPAIDALIKDRDDLKRLP